MVQGQRTSYSHASNMLSNIVATLVLSAAASAKLLYAGINESGGEFGVYSTTATKGTGLPGTFGVDYRFINEVCARDLTAG